MMIGTVTSRREAVLHLIVRDAAGNDFEYHTVIDTGYNGSLTLPPSEIAALGLTWQRYGRAQLADGSEALFNIYEGVVMWDGQPITVDIDEMDADPLVGMSLMYGYESNLPVLDGAAFTLQRIGTP